MSSDRASDLAAVAKALVADGKGILAADESDGTIKKRFDSIGVESTEDNRRAYRELLFTHRGRRGVHQRRDPVRRDDPPERGRRDAAPASCSTSKGSSPGSRSTRARSRSRSPRARRSPRASTGCASGSRSTASSARASPSGARRTPSATGIPSEYCVWTNAHALARYAALCQEAGIVPIVEPEVLMDGDAHDRAALDGVTGRVLQARLHRAPRPARRARRARCSSRTWCSPATARRSARGRRRGRRARRSSAFYRHVPAAVPGHRVPLRRPDRRGRDRAPERDERARPAPVAAVVLVRPRAAGARAEGVGGQGGERRGRAARATTTARP